jgi:hypothetical protein
VFLLAGIIAKHRARSNLAEPESTKYGSFFDRKRIHLGFDAMADAFSPGEWTKIHTQLAENEVRYGLPQRRDGSVVLASFNIRKCGNPAKRTAGALDLMTTFIRRCDLVAVQEVMSDLSMIEELRGRAPPTARPGNWSCRMSPGA